MNTQVAAQTLLSRERQEARQFSISSRQHIKKALLKRYDTLTEAAEKAGLSYARLMATIAGRESNFTAIEALQSELGLTNEQVLEFWPLVRRWPRKERQVS